MMKPHRFVTYTIPILVVNLSLIIAILVLITIHKGEYNNSYAFNKTGFSDFNFAAAGDWGCFPQTKMVVNNIINKNPELVLGLGDYAYRNDGACWFEIIKPIENKMKIVIGNHDVIAYVDGIYVPSKELLGEYMNQFNLTEQFYSFDYQNVHFLAIATEDSYEKDSVQYRFVQNDLKNAASSNNIDWIVVFYHRVAYTSPGMIGSVVDFRNTYHPLFDKYGVDIVLQAHIHNYQRSFPISYNSGNSSNPIITDHAISNYNDPKGQIFAIVGTGGSKVIHNLTGTPAKFTAKQFYGYGFLNLYFTQNGTTLVGEFHDNDNTIKDRFSITKLNFKQNSSMTSSASTPRLMNEFEVRMKGDYWELFQN